MSEFDQGTPQPENQERLQDISIERRRQTDTLVDPQVPLVQKLLERYVSTTENLPEIEIPYERNEFWPLLSVEVTNLKHEYNDTTPFEDDSNFKHLPTALRNVNREIRHQQELRDAELRYHLDPLTGAYSPAYYRNELPQQVTEDLEKGLSVAMLKIDVDDFKKVNDELGHSAGDVYLQQVVQFLKAHIRLNDKVLRSGGDEFDIYLSGIDMDTVMKIAERIHSKSQDMPFKFSIGIATNQGRKVDAEQLIKDADVAAYHSKRDSEGNSLKNRYTVFTEGMIMPESGKIEDR